MPYVATVAVLDLLCVVHAVRTGRPLYWVFIVLAFPVLGAAAYVLAELVPELLHGQGARNIVQNAREAIDPERHYRKLVHELDVADTTENRRALAEECLHLGKTAEAIQLYESTLVGLHRSDPALLMGLARACFLHGTYDRCREILEQVRRDHPKHISADGHLLYARSLEGSGRLEEALAEYHALAQYFPGEEARCRYALALRKSGQTEAARQVFDDIVRFVGKRPKHYERAQREWYEIAKQHLT